MQERYSHDELFFYLHARKILFWGAQLSDSSATYERIFKISFEKIFLAI